MSHVRNYDNNKGSGPYRTQKFTNGRDRNNRPYSNFQYYGAKYNFQPPWGYRRRRPPYHRTRRTPEKNRPRSPSPFSGTEEHTLKKIQETSDMIKKRLMMLETGDVVDSPQALPVQQTENEDENKTNKSEKNLIKTNKKVAHYDVGEIHQKIITHITKLSHGRKMNLISANSSGYDVAIQQIHKQKRLELSKVLRDMCSNHTIENSEVINAIIPDIGIKIEDLPLEVIQELSSTLDLNFDASFFTSSDQTVSVKTEISENDLTLDQEENCDMICASPIKEEKIDVCENEIPSVQSEGSSYFYLFNNGAEIKQELKTECNSDKAIEIEKDSNLSKKTITTQTELPSFRSISTQTESASQFCIDQDVNSLDNAVTAMLEIDQEITRLTKLRQSIFTKLQEKKIQPKPKKELVNTSKRKTIVKKGKKIQAKKSTKIEKVAKKTKSKESSVEENCIEVVNKEKNFHYEKALEFQPISEKILVMKVVEDTILAASEKGNIFLINIQHGTIQATIHVSKAPITSLCYWMTKKGNVHVFVGSSAPKLHEYNYDSKQLVRLIDLEQSIQCMDLAWQWVFIGSVNGDLVRYSFKTNKIEFQERISQDRIMVLKATLEGARRVLLVGMRNAAVCVRDAMSGLHLRTMNELVTPTVYSLILENSMVYCGTTFHDILVFRFHDGNLVHKHEATNSKGICCLKVVGNLLFASCYNGNIYVYDIKTHVYVGLIEGPGGVILSMEIVKNIVIVGTMSLKLKSILIPDHMLEHNKI